jgi:hypothetical protein
MGAPIWGTSRLDCAQAAKASAGRALAAGSKVEGEGASADHLIQLGLGGLFRNRTKLRDRPTTAT